MSLLQQLSILQSTLDKQEALVTKFLNPGIGEIAIHEALEKAGIVDVPLFVRELYQWHDGTEYQNGMGGEPLFPRTFFYSLKDAVRVKSDIDTHAQELMNDMFYEDQGASFYWNKSILPIFHQIDGGTYLLIDCSFYETQISSPVFYYWIGDSDLGNHEVYEFGMPIIYDDVEAMFLTINECFRKGAYRLSDDKKVFSNRELEIQISLENNPKSDFWRNLLAE